jgi:hypothetical protein
MKSIVILSIIIFSLNSAFSQKIKDISIVLETGSAHINPSFSIWLEDTLGRYTETIYVTKSVGTGLYSSAKKVKGRWKSGVKIIEGNLPIWSRRRNISNNRGGYTPEPNTKEPDAVTGATPIGNTIIHYKYGASNCKKFVIWLEINQSHDFNEYYPANAYLDELQNTIGQPSLVYAVIIDLRNLVDNYEMILLGHSNPSGNSGEIIRSMAEITTAKNLVSKLEIRITR